MLEPTNTPKPQTELKWVKMGVKTLEKKHFGRLFKINYQSRNKY